MNSKLKAALMVGTALAITAGSAAAQTGPDITEATASLTAVGTSVTSLGQLMLAAVGAGIVFKWVVAYLI